MAFPTRFQRGYVRNDTAAGVARFAQRHHHHVIGYAEILHRAGEHEGVGWDDAVVSLGSHQTVRIERFGVDHGVEGVDKDVPLGRRPEVVAETREAVADDPVANQTLFERLDHSAFGLLPDPPIGLDAHEKKCNADCSGSAYVLPIRWWHLYWDRDAHAMATGVATGRSQQLDVMSCLDIAAPQASVVRTCFRSTTVEGVEPCRASGCHGGYTRSCSAKKSWQPN